MLSDGEKSDWTLLQHQQKQFIYICQINHAKNQ
jgi:hypothetical protein